ncbi:MAG: hotdog fold thioesterase [Sphingobacteriales bacterium]|jgi:acyl-CoA thioesterase|nr:hotdog fold thioesterase [Sphingobacteriales bacterium]
MSKAEEIVHKMFDNDAFSKWLGIEVIEIGEGVSTLRMTVRKEMLNGFEVLHGGITYSLADSALAFASNAYGRKSMSIETSISHTLSCKEGDLLTTKTVERSLSNKIGVYDITVLNQDEKVVALFKGTVYRSDKNW